MMVWPDASFTLLQRYAEQLNCRIPRYRRPAASILRCFQRFVMARAVTPDLSRFVIESWLREVDAVSPRSMVVRRAQIVDSFLDWLVEHGHLAANPFAELRARCEPRGTRSIVPALLSDDPDAALERMRPLPRYGSCFGAVLSDHVARMRTLGYRCGAGRFLRFDRFVQQRLGAEAEPLPSLIRAFVAEARSPACQIERLKVGRILAREVQRIDPHAPDPPAYDRLVTRAMVRERRRPYIYSPDEIDRLFRTAREFPSPKAPLRPPTLYTMLVLAYCVGLRMGELVRLKLRDLRFEEGALEIRETKFFKSRRLPIRPSVVTALTAYLQQRAKAGSLSEPDAPLFCHEGGGYAFITAEQLLRRVIRAAGLKPEPGRRGPRIHDLRHTFVVHRMIGWYRQGINPQARLPYLSTYLGHRDIHSTLVYLTITQELLGLANERFRALGASLLAATEGQTHDHNPVAPTPAAGVLSQLACPAAGRFGQHRPRVPRHLATVPAIRGEAPAARSGRSRPR
jgi:integrase